MHGFLIYSKMDKTISITKLDGFELALHQMDGWCHLPKSYEPFEGLVEAVRSEALLECRGLQQ